MKTIRLITVILSLLILFCTTRVMAKNIGSERVDLGQGMQSLAMPFIVNDGQVDEEVVGYAETLGGTLFVTKNSELIYSLPKFDDRAKRQNENHKRVIIKEQVDNGKIGVVQFLRPTETRVNYFRGNNPQKWHRNVPTYRELSLGEIYDGIELRLKAYSNNVEKLFHVASGANPNLIKMKLTGAGIPTVNSQGELVLQSALGPISFTKPLAWQEINGKRINVPAAYQILSSSRDHCTYSFSLNQYDSSHPIIIDPLLASTYVGGRRDEVVHYECLTIDDSDSVYIAGHNWGGAYPTTTGAVDTTYNDEYDIIISKLSSDLTTLEASTYLGGTGFDQAYSLALSGSSVFVAGRTSSTDYPIPGNGYTPPQGSKNGGFDVVISKLNSSLSSLEASTYIGGSDDEEAQAISVVGSSVYVTGWSKSDNYPDAGGYNNDNNGHIGNDDIIISKLDTGLTTHTSTYLGGAGLDRAYSIAIYDSFVYVAGLSESNNYPTTAGVYNTDNSGGIDVIISRLSNDLATLNASTYLGGTEDDLGVSLDINDSYVYVAGWAGWGFPTTVGAYDTTYDANADIFISRLPHNLATLNASTYLGEIGSDRGVIKLDGSGNVYVVGHSKSVNFPVTTNAYDESHNGGEDGIIARLSADLSTLHASTFLGGNGDDYLYSLAFDGSGNVVVAGWSNSTDYPIPSAPYQPYQRDKAGDAEYHPADNSDVIISKLTADLLAAQYTLSLTKAGSGTGTVSSSPPGIDCNDACTDGQDADFFDHTNVILTAVAAAGSTFTGWSGGGCSGTDPCTVTIDGAQNITATFASSDNELAVNLSGSGLGNVGSNPAGINCPASDCYADFILDDTVELTATPASGSRFGNWTGNSCDSITSPSCTVTIAQFNEPITAEFIALHKLIVSKTGMGAGTVTLDQPGNSCDPPAVNCSWHDYGTQITLEAFPEQGSLFVGWPAEDCIVLPNEPNKCQIIMQTDKTVTAQFAVAKTLTVNILGGSGKVISAPSGIDCGSTCNAEFAEDTSITLTAIPETGGNFIGWLGACRGKGTCTVTLYHNTSVTAQFIGKFPWNLVLPAIIDKQ